MKSETKVLYLLREAFDAMKGIYPRGQDLSPEERSLAHEIQREQRARLRDLIIYMEIDAAERERSENGGNQ